MTTEGALVATRRKRAPSLDARPGQSEAKALTHLFTTTSPCSSIHEDVDEVNWQGIETELTQSIIRIEHEGELSTQIVQESCALLDIALQKLDLEDAVFQRILLQHPPLGFWEWVFIWTPTAAGKKRRGDIGARRYALRRSGIFREIRNRLLELRIRLAGVVDTKIDAILMGVKEYANLHQNVVAIAGNRETCRSIYEQLQELEQIELSLAINDDDYKASVREKEMRRQQILLKMEAFAQFCLTMSDQQTTGRAIRNFDRERIFVFVTHMLSSLDAQVRPHEQRMAAMRDAYKKNYYYSRGNEEGNE